MYTYVGPVQCIIIISNPLFATTRALRYMLKKIAHNPTISALAGNQDLRPLQDLISAEKAIIISLQKLTAEFSKASEALKTWGLGEGEDLGNILSASTTIITHFTSALSQYASHGHTMREQLKAIRTREENLDELKRRRRSVLSKAESADKKLQKMGPEHKNLAQQQETLNRFREEIRGLDAEIMRDEAALGDFKRAATRSWMGLKFGGLLECCEKGVIVGEYGKLLVGEIPEDVTQPGFPRNPYFGHAKIEELVAENHRYVNEVRLSTVPSATQPRRVEQQLPQVPHISESPFINQGSLSSSPYPVQPQLNVEAYRDEVSAPLRDILSDNQGFGTGRFLESPTDATPSPFSQRQEHRQQYSGSLSNASALQSQSGRQVDEFGSTHPTGLIDTSNASGGRFATFPVRGRTGSLGGPGSAGYQPGPEASPSLYSPAVTQALATTSQGLQDNEQQRLPPPGRPGRFDGPAPSYESSIESENPWTGNQGARLGPNEHRTAATNAGQTSNIADDEALLAYMSPEHRATEVATSAGRIQGTGGVNDKHVSRHVRFGTVSEIDDAPLPPITPQYSSFSPSPEPFGGQGEGSRVMSSDFMDARESWRLPPTVSSPEEQEKALDAAAAREIALELHSTASSSTAHGPAADTQSPSPGDMTPSPLAPPTASYMTSEKRRSVSPRPPINVSIAVPPVLSPEILSPGPAPSYTEEPPSHNQQYYDEPAGSAAVQMSPPTQHQAPVLHVQGEIKSRLSPETPHHQSYGPPQGAQGPQGLPGKNQAQLSRGEEFNPYEEQPYPQEKGRGDSASPRYMEQKSSLPPPRINTPPQADQSGSFSYYAQPGAEVRGGRGAPAGEYEPRAHPTSPLLEQPNAPYMRPGIGNLSTSSLNGGGKISAAAFKRPPPRLGGSASPFAPPSPSLFSNESPNLGGGSTKMSSTEGERLYSPYESNSSDLAPSYAPSSAQGIPPLNVGKRETQDLDPEQYDYINAYVDNNADELDAGDYYTEQAQRASDARAGGGGWAGIGSQVSGQEGGRGGYGQGRFATNLEHDRLR